MLRSSLDIPKQHGGIRIPGNNSFSALQGLEGYKSSVGNKPRQSALHGSGAFGGKKNQLVLND